MLYSNILTQIAQLQSIDVLHAAKLASLPLVGQLSCPELQSIKHTLLAFVQQRIIYSQYNGAAPCMDMIEFELTA